MTGEKGGSKLEEILKGGRGTGGKEAQSDQPDLRSTLEKELDGEDTELAKELQRTRAEEIIQRRRIAIDRMRGGAAAPDTGGVKVQERGKDWLLDYTQGMLEKGLDPITVGKLVDYLLGGSQFPQIGMPGAGAPPQGITFADMMSFAKMMQENNRADPTLTALLTKLTEKVEAVEKIAAARPAAEPVKRSAFIIKADGNLEEVSLDRPILLEPKPSAIDGKPIEVVKEENRHLEKMEELKTDKEHKKSIADTLASIPEKIGRGLAGQALGEEEEVEPGSGAVAKIADQEHFKCEQCGTEFMIPVDALTITCPNCTQADGSPTVYTRTKKA